MSETYCQCCGMPLGASGEMRGTKADGSVSADYCKYCFEDGKFIFNGTMQEMIEICVPHMLSANPAMSEDEARGMMQKVLPTLKRWKENP
jgi:hypothetical protein